MNPSMVKDKSAAVAAVRTSRRRERVFFVRMAVIVATTVFAWNGQEIVLGTPLTAPKMKVLPENSKVLTIVTNTWPHKVLQIRGTATVESVDGVVPEYAAAALRYFGEEQDERG